MMCDWTRWTQRACELSAEEDYNRMWHRRTFLEQMVEIEGELSRVFCNEDGLERIRSDPGYMGEPQTIQSLFKIIKSDPKNAALLREIGRAEEEVYAYLAGVPGAPPEEALRAYWQRVMDSYIAEIGQRCPLKKGDDLP